MRLSIRYYCGMALLLVSSASAHAQKLRVEGGVNYSNIRLSMPEINYSGDLLLGYRVGLGVELTKNKMWHITPMLMLRSTGGYMNLRAEPMVSRASLDIPHEAMTSSIQSPPNSYPSLRGHQAYLPFFLGLKAYPIPGWLGVQLELGPYVGYTFSNKLHTDKVVIDLMSLKTTTTGLLELQRWDYGVAGSVGLCISKLYIKAGLEYGLMNQLKFGALGKTTAPRLVQKLQNIPQLQDYSVKKLIKASAANLNFHLSLGVTL